ncbi:MAG: SIMPL domain-containing protein [Candidatus Saccharimonadales bacterium]
MPPAQNAPAPDKHRLNLRLDLRLVSLLLLAIIAVMLVLWKPWTDSKAGDRTVQVTGLATVKAEPDEYVFYPTYEFKNSDQQVALAALTKKSDELVAGLKKAGVPESGIKTNADSYDKDIYLPAKDTSGSTYTLRLTVTVGDKALAQKAQDYLVGTTPSGQVTPQAGFSDAKRKSLESQARDQAEKDARTKAEQSAKNLGFKIAKVKSIADSGGFGGPISLAEDKAVSSPQLDIQPGENELTYTVSVTYYIK